MLPLILPTNESAVIVATVILPFTILVSNGLISLIDCELKLIELIRMNESVSESLTRPE